MRAQSVPVRGFRTGPADTNTAMFHRRWGLREHTASDHRRQVQHTPRRAAAMDHSRAKEGGLSHRGSESAGKDGPLKGKIKEEQEGEGDRART